MNQSGESSFHLNPGMQQMHKVMKERGSWSSTADVVARAHLPEDLVPGHLTGTTRAQVELALRPACVCVTQIRSITPVRSEQLILNRPKNEIQKHLCGSLIPGPGAKWFALWDCLEANSSHIIPEQIATARCDSKIRISRQARHFLDCVLYGEGRGHCQVTVDRVCIVCEIRPTANFYWVTYNVRGRM